MANRWGKNGNSDRFYFLDSKIIADNDCSHKIKRHLFLGRKAMTNLVSLLKGIVVILLTKVCIVKPLLVPLVMYRCESWTKKKAESQRIDALQLFWGRLLRVPWTARSHKSILKEILPEYSLEGLMLKLKLQFFGHLMQKANSLEKILILGKTEGWKKRGQQSKRRLDGITDSMGLSLINLREIEKDREIWYTAVHGVEKSSTQLSDWTTTNILRYLESNFTCCEIAIIYFLNFE